jgi:hypothetical protein
MLIAIAGWTSSNELSCAVCRGLRTVLSLRPSRICQGIAIPTGMTISLSANARELENHQTEGSASHQKPFIHRGMRTFVPRFASKWQDATIQPWV